MNESMARVSPQDLLCNFADNINKKEMTLTPNPEREEGILLTTSTKSSFSKRRKLKKALDLLLPSHLQTFQISVENTNIEANQNPDQRSSGDENGDVMMSIRDDIAFLDGFQHCLKMAMEELRTELDQLDKNNRWNAGKSKSKPMAREQWYKLLKQCALLIFVMLLQLGVQLIFLNQ